MRKVIVGVSVAVVLVAGLMTVVPIGSGTYTSQAFAMTSTHQPTSVWPCADVELTGELMAEIRQPPLNVWNVSAIRDASINELVIRATPGEDCPGTPSPSNELSGMATYILISNPSCNNPYVMDGDEISNESVDEFTRCGGKAMYFVTYDIGPEGLEQHRSGWGYRLGNDSSLTRSDTWCLDAEVAVDITVGGNRSDMGPGVVPEPLACLPLR